MKHKKRWTKEPGWFIIGPDNGGTWNQAGLESGFASASVYNQDHPAARVLVNAGASMSPAQARQLAQVLMDAADRADASTFKVTATPIKKVMVRHSRHADEETRVLIESLSAERSYLKGLVKRCNADGSKYTLTFEMRLATVEKELEALLEASKNKKD